MADGPLLNSYNAISAGLDSVVADSFTNMSNAVFPTITGSVIVLIAYQGYKVFYGRGSGELVANSILILVKYTIIMALFATFSLYQTFIVDLFESTPGSIGAVFTASWSDSETDGSIIKMLDDFARTVGKKAADHSWGSSIGEKFEALVFSAVAYLYVVFAAVQFMIAEIVTKLFLMLTPLALAAILFDKTKGIFEGWLRTLTTMAILKVLLIVMVTLMMGLFGDAANNLEPKTREGAASIGVFLLIVLLMMLVTFRLPDLASQLGGGLSVSAAGVVVAAAAAGTAAMAGAFSGADRAQRGFRQGKNAANEAGMTGREAMKAGVVRGATEAARPGLTQRRFEDQRMSRRASQQVGAMKRSGSSGESSSGGSQSGNPAKGSTPDQKADVAVAQMKKNTSNDNKA